VARCQTFVFHCPHGWTSSSCSVRFSHASLSLIKCEIFTNPGLELRVDKSPGFTLDRICARIVRHGPRLVFLANLVKIIVPFPSDQWINVGGSRWFDRPSDWFQWLQIRSCLHWPFHRLVHRYSFATCWR